MEQTKLESLAETTADIATGFIVSWLVMTWVVPVLFPDFDPGAGTAFWLTVVFTVTSFIRRYLWRRFFARGFHKIVHQFLRRVIYGC